VISESKNWKSRTILFLVSQCITLFGSTLVQMAIVWFVTLKTSSGVWVAAFTICSYLPQFIISFIGGVWADRYSRKMLIIAADSIIALVTLAMLLVMPHITTESTLLGSLLIMSAIRSLGAGVQTPAVNAVVPLLVPEPQLMRFNGINATMQSMVQFAAPAAAGAILSLSTLRSTLLIDILTAVLGISLLACIVIPKHEVQKEKVPVSADIKIGIQYAFSSKMIGKLLVVYGLFIFFSVPAGFLAQLFVSRTFGDTYWYLTAVELVGFAGMIAGGLIISAWGGFKSRIKTLTIALAANGLLTAMIGLSQSFMPYLTMMLVYGITVPVVQTATTTLIQEKVEISMQGRVFGLLNSVYSGFLPIGMAIFGPLADKIALQWIIIGSGVVLILIAATCPFSKHFTHNSELI